MKRVFDPRKSVEPLQSAARDQEPEFSDRCKLQRSMGIARLLRSFLKAWIKPGRSYRILDLASGTGEAVRLLADWSRKQGISVKIDAMEMDAALLEIARGQAADYPEISFIHADPGSSHGVETYDLACCLSVFRDFSGEEVSRMIRTAGEASHDKVLVAGLDRRLASMPGVYLMTAAVFGAPVGRAEARSSIGRAFTFDELDELARRAGWRNYGHRRYLPACQAIWMCKREVAGAPVCELPVPDFAA